MVCISFQNRKQWTSRNPAVLSNSKLFRERERERERGREGEKENVNGLIHLIIECANTPYDT
jgi:hypothetical protein